MVQATMVQSGEQSLSRYGTRFAELRDQTEESVVGGYRVIVLQLCSRLGIIVQNLIDSGHLPDHGFPEWPEDLGHGIELSMSDWWLGGLACLMFECFETAIPCDPQIKWLLLEKYVGPKAEYDECCVFPDGENSPKTWRAVCEASRQAIVYFLDCYEAIPNAEDRSQSRERERMSLIDAGKKAWQLCESEPDFKDKTSREWAKAIGCSLGLIPKLPAWKAVREELLKKQNDRPAKSPPVCTLTDKLSATLSTKEDPAMLAEKREDMVHSVIERALPEERAHLETFSTDDLVKMEELAQEQDLDAATDPSPLAEDPPDAPTKQPRIRKQL